MAKTPRAETQKIAQAAQAKRQAEWQQGQVDAKRNLAQLQQTQVNAQRKLAETQRSKAASSRRPMELLKKRAEQFEARIQSNRVKITARRP